MMGDVLREYVGKTVIMKYLDFSAKDFYGTTVVGKVVSYDSNFVRLNPFISIDTTTNEAIGPKDTRAPIEKVVKVFEKIKAGTDKHDRVVGLNSVRTIELLV